jgi:hypothetical protein
MISLIKVSWGPCCGEEPDGMQVGQVKWKRYDMGGKGELAGVRLTGWNGKFDYY